MRNPKTTLLVGLLVIATLAGCIDTQDGLETSQAPTTQQAIELLPWLHDDHPEHDHSDPTQHRGGWNMELVAHHFLTDDPVGRPAWINQLVVHEGFVFISAYEIPPSMQPGLMVLDATDPYNVSLASAFIYPEVTPIDVFLSDDGRYAFLAGHRWTPDGHNPSPELVPDGCIALPDEVPIYNQLCNQFVPFGVYAVNVEDPYDPHFAGKVISPPSGAHTVKYGKVDDGPGTGEYLFLASYGVTGMNRLASSVDTYMITEGPGRVGTDDTNAPLGDELLFIEQGRYFLPPANDPTGGDGRGIDGRPFVHDVWFDQHPVTQDYLLYIAGWDAGIHIIDYSVPAAPQPVSVWHDYDGFELYGNTHGVYTPPEMVDDIYYMVVSPEYAQVPHSGKLWFVDITDPTDPVTLGEFVVPGDPGHDEHFDYLYSPHNLLIENGVAYHGHNHLGTWAIDLSTRDNLTDPKALGFVMPVPEDPTLYPTGDHIRAIPAIWNAWVEDGYVFSSERYTGVYIHRLIERHPGDPPWAGWDLAELREQAAQE
jgi:hypothetical protein